MTPDQTAFTDTLISRTVRERIVLVGVTVPPSTQAATEAALDELARLVDTAGADVVDRVMQRRDAPDPSTYLGRGKAADLRAICLATDADTVVFDNDLSPAQQRNLEQILGRTAIDRTAVILDIFAQNARTPEGRAQVELALLRYRLPRLRGRGTSFSQQAGGIGTRGPGETQLEVDRRRLASRMRRLESDLRQLERTRRTQRRSRTRSRQRLVSLVGYTNAGKSTLLNRLSGADVLVENRLFSTLDPRTRQLDLPGGETVLLTDTVGFVRKLPHQLVESFHSTLEVVVESDLVIHVVDGSAPDLEGQVDAVHSVLAEIGADDRPELLVVNKIDQSSAMGEEARRLLEAHPGALAISARTGAGIDELLETMCDRLRIGDRVVELEIPWTRGDVLAAVHREGGIVGEIAGEGSTRIQVVLDDAGAWRFKNSWLRDLRRITARRVPTAALSLCRASTHWRPRRSASSAPKGWSTAPWEPRAIRHWPLSSMPWPDPRRRVAIRRPWGRAPIAVPRPTGSRAASAWPSIPRRSWRPAWERRSSWHRWPSTSASGPRIGTPCSTRRSPTRPTPWARCSAGCRAVGVPEHPSGGLDLAAVDDADVARALLLWTNSPSNPSGRLTDPDEVAAWARSRGVPVFADECYAEFTWRGRPRSMLETGAQGVVAVHSLSKRSNLAGARAGFYAGDAELVGYLADVRRHAGLMVPGPVQDAAVVALGNDLHVDEQRRDTDNGWSSWPPPSAGPVGRLTFRTAAFTSGCRCRPISGTAGP